MENLQRHTVSGLRHICDLLGAPETEDDAHVAEMVSRTPDPNLWWGKYVGASTPTLRKMVDTVWHIYSFPLDAKLKCRKTLYQVSGI